MLQIYIERIVDAILEFKAKWRKLAQEDLKLIQVTPEGRRFAPLLPNLQSYSKLLNDIICHYSFIIQKYALAISNHFTRMTKVINGNTYEFPSQDMHRTIINKLILFDRRDENFDDFFAFIKQEHAALAKSLASS